MKIRVALAAASLLALSACENQTNATNAVDNADLGVTDVTNVEEPETPVANVANATAPAVSSNASAEEQTQEDAVATGMTAHVDRGNETAPAQ